MKPKYKKQCIKCKNFYIPDKTPGSKNGYCKNCRIQPGKCKWILKTGYQCPSNPDFFGYCTTHFFVLPLSKLRSEAKKL